MLQDDGNYPLSLHGAVSRVVTSPHSKASSNKENPTSASSAYLLQSAASMPSRFWYTAQDDLSNASLKANALKLKTKPFGASLYSES